jgi:hypothetical protein
MRPLLSGGPRCHQAQTRETWAPSPADLKNANQHYTLFSGSRLLGNKDKLESKSRA